MERLRNSATQCLLKQPPAAVTVAIVTWNSDRFLPAALASLDKALSGVAWNLVIADNGSQDDSLATIQRLRPDATIVRLGYNAGYSAGLNAAMAAAHPDSAVLCLNPDILLDGGCVRALLGAFDRPDVGIAVPRLTDADGKLQPSLRRQPSVLRALGEAVLGGNRAGRVACLGELVTDYRRYKHAGVVDWATGAVMLVSPSCRNAVGPWNETFLLYSEETEYALRARDHGYSVWYCPDARAIHIGGSSQTSAELYTLLSANRIRLFKMRHGPVHSSLFYAAVVINEGLRIHRHTHRKALIHLLTRDRRNPVKGLGR